MKKGALLLVELEVTTLCGRGSLKLGVSYFLNCCVWLSEGVDAVCFSKVLTVHFVVYASVLPFGANPVCGS